MDYGTKSFLIEEGYLDEISSNIVAPVVGAAIGTAFGLYLRKKIENRIAKECAKLSGAERKKCLIVHHNSEVKKYINQYKTALKNCRTSKNPSKCQKDYTGRIKYMERLFKPVPA
jgi:phosphate/sulfate permease